MNRICMPDAIEALAALDESGWRVFAWDILEAAAVDDDIDNRMLRGDGSLKLDDPGVRAILNDIALADRLWRYMNAFVWQIHNN